MRITIVIITLIGLMSMAMDAVQDVGKIPDHALLSSNASLQDSTAATVAVDVDAAEKRNQNQGPVHLMEIKEVSILGTLVLIGVALAGLIGAPQRKTQKSRARRSIT